MVEKLESLKSISYFAGCTDEELESFKKYVTEQKVDQGEVFLHDGDYSDYLYSVVSGAVKVYKTSADGREQILHIERPGGSVNEVSTFDGGPIAAHMLAMTPVVLYRIKKTDLMRIIENHHQVAMNIIRALADRVRRDSSLVRELSFTQVAGRLAKIILNFIGGAEEDGLHLTQQDLAAMVGTSREVVNRTLRQMEESGAIRLERRGIVIVDKGALEEMVKATS